MYGLDLIWTCHLLNELLHWDTGGKIIARFLKGRRVQRPRLLLSYPTREAPPAARTFG